MNVTKMSWERGHMYGVDKSRGGDMDRCLYWAAATEEFVGL
jgi:hypothetical protein